jgi:hypothetical protein
MGANRNFGGRVRSLERETVHLYGKFTGKGAAQIESVDCLGFTITRTGVGLFTITLDDQWPTADATPATPPLLIIKSHRTAAAARATGEMQSIVNSSAAAAKTGAAADVADTDIIYLELIFRNTSLPRKGV